MPETLGSGRRLNAAGMPGRIPLAMRAGGAAASCVCSASRSGSRGAAGAVTWSSRSLTAQFRWKVNTVEAVALRGKSRSRAMNAS